MRRVLSKIYSDKNEIIRNDSFPNINLNNNQDLIVLIENLRNVFENWSG